MKKVKIGGGQRNAGEMKMMEINNEKLAEQTKKYFAYAQAKKIGQNPAKNPDAILEQILAKIKIVDIGKLNWQILRDGMAWAPETKTVMDMENLLKAIMAQ